MKNLKLRGARAEKGLTQKELSKLIEMPLATYVAKEQGRYQFTVSEAQTIAEVLGKNPSEIFFNAR